MFRSIKTTLTLLFGSMLLVAIIVPTTITYQMTKQTYLDRELSTIAYLTDQLAVQVTNPASDSRDAGSFHVKAGWMLESLNQKFFAERGMTGYALITDLQGRVIWHPKLEGGFDLSTAGEQGATLVKLAQDAQFTGVIHYDWQNTDETSPRAKFAILQPLPTKPEWALWVTAYTTDDLLKPFTQIFWIVCGVAAAIMLLLSIGWFRVRSVALAIDQLKGALERIAGGNLQVQEGDLNRLLSRKDELGAMGTALTDMVGSLRTLIGGVKENTQHLMLASDGLKSSSDTAAEASAAAAEATALVADGASQQAAVAQEVSRTMGQFHETIHQIASGAEDTAVEVQNASTLLSEMVHALEEMSGDAAGVAGEARKTAETAQRSASVVQMTVEGMNRIRENALETSRQITALEKLSVQIGQITQSITEIAEQTNLLALNAAIEAARAGEHGRGFAVVADEVRKLSERATHSTRSISELVSRIQAQTASAVQVIEAGSTEVEKGTQLAGDAGQALVEIMGTVERAATSINQIAEAAQGVRQGAQKVVEAFNSVAAVTEENTAATEEMAAGATQVTEAVQRIAGIAQENAAGTEEVSSSVDELNATAGQLADSAKDLSEISSQLMQQVNRFRV